MMTETENLVLEHLRLMRDQLSTMNKRQLEIIQRLGSLVVEVPNPSVRVDRIDIRPDRVEKRLGPIEA
jgi:hypothetical protein